MYYRRKILLSLLQVFNNRLDKMSMQKLLFLFCRLQKKPDYYFIPFKYGCFSFQANADLTTLAKYSQVGEDENEWSKLDKTDYIRLLKENDKESLFLVRKMYGAKTKDELVRFTYLQYPYYAIHSSICSKILNHEEQEMILKSRPTSKISALFTIGYEGITIEQYLNKLIKNDIRVLCDVRKNPVSMKYGFNKNQLKKACEGIGIKYLHFPEVGIESDQRQQLKSQNDYNNLFDRYRSITLQSQIKIKEELLSLLKTNKRIALTCFEANICQCHRKVLAESIAGMEQTYSEIKHI